MWSFASCCIPSLVCLFSCDSSDCEASVKAHSLVHWQPWMLLHTHLQFWPFRVLNGTPETQVPYQCDIIYVPFFPLTVRSMARVIISLKSSWWSNSGYAWSPPSVELYHESPIKRAQFCKFQTNLPIDLLPATHPLQNPVHGWWYSYPSEKYWSVGMIILHINVGIAIIHQFLMVYTTHTNGD